MTSSLAAALAASKAKADNIDNNDNNDIHTKASKAASSSLMQHAKQQKPKPTKRVEKEKKQQAAFTSPAKQSLAVASASAGAEKQGMHNSQDIKPTPLKNDKYNGKHFDNNYNDNNNNHTPKPTKGNAKKAPKTPKSNIVNIKRNKPKNNHSADKEDAGGDNCDKDNDKNENNDNVQEVVFVCDIPSSDEEEEDEEEEKHVNDDEYQSHNNPRHTKNQNGRKGKKHEQHQQKQQHQQGGKIININASRRMIGHALGTRLHDDAPNKGGNRNQSDNDKEPPSNPGAMPTPWSKKAEGMGHGKQVVIPGSKSNGGHLRDHRSNRDDNNNVHVGKDNGGFRGHNSKNNNYTRNNPRDKSHQKSNNSHSDHNHRENERRSSRNDGRGVSSTGDDDRRHRGNNTDSLEFNSGNDKIDSNASSVTSKPVSVVADIPKLESALLKGRWADEDSSSDEE
mmetsp:Transcript_8359/g.17455  ORF Transcript_8359/g.17455 Transcript_8359/m.17455 type:complete len:451 (+) Transcript_8359:108-1460(+)